MYGGSFSTCGGTSCSQEAGRRWSDAGADRQGASQRAVSQPMPNAAELRIAELERLLGRKQLELDFLKRTFEQVGGVGANRTSDGGKGSIAQSKPRSRSKG